MRFSVDRMHDEQRHSADRVDRVGPASDSEAKHVECADCARHVLYDRPVLRRRERRAQTGHTERR
jgi:hypothetical protein